MTNTNDMREAFDLWIEQHVEELIFPLQVWEAACQWQSQQAQGGVVAYYDPRPGVDWEYRFLEPDAIGQEDNRKFYTVPLIANQPAPAAVPDEAFNIIEGIRAELTWGGWRSAHSRDWVMDSVSELLSMLTASPAPDHAAEADVCQNCETALPEGCGGIFAHNGTACRYAENQQEEEENDRNN